MNLASVMGSVCFQLGDLEDLGGGGGCATLPVSTFLEFFLCIFILYNVAVHIFR